MSRRRVAGIQRATAKKPGQVGFNLREDSPAAREAEAVAGAGAGTVARNVAAAVVGAAVAAEAATEAATATVTVIVTIRATEEVGPIAVAIVVTPAGAETAGHTANLAVAAAAAHLRESLLRRKRRRS